MERVLPGKPSRACSSGSTSERRDDSTRTPPRTQSPTSAAYCVAGVAISIRRRFSRVQKRRQHMGRPPKLTPAQKSEARRRCAELPTMGLPGQNRVHVVVPVFPGLPARAHLWLDAKSRRSSISCTVERAAIGEVGGDPGGAEGAAADRRRDAGRCRAPAGHPPGIRLAHWLVG